MGLGLVKGARSLKREPGNNALEVLRRSDNRLIGWITSVDASRLKCKRAFPFALQTGGPLEDGLEPVQNFTFMIDWVTFSIARSFIEDLPKGDLEIYLTNKAPYYAESSIFIATGAHRISWFALMLDDDHIEMIFDHPAFEPA